MNLPIKFQEKMNLLLGDDAIAFFESFEEKDEKAFWLNTSLISPEVFEKCEDFSFEKIPHISHGYYYNETNLKIGHQPLHHGGAFYSQDPAAMLPTQLIPINPNWKVLDLCAAPGGKSTQLASVLSKGEGALLANEIHPGRNRILVENMERMAFRNVLITKLSPKEIASVYASYFDLVLVDAPCSGEGMFRKYPESISEWSQEQVELCSIRQKEILNDALSCVKPGGYLIYSTCTYSAEENEEIIRWITKNHPFSPVEAPEHIIKVTSGNKQYPELEFACRRCYPHLYKGEGQFMCCLQKEGTLSENTFNAKIPLKKINNTTLKLLQDSIKNAVNLPLNCLYEYKDKVLVIPENFIKLPPRGITSCGVILGNIENKRFVLHHQFFKAYKTLFQNQYETASAKEANEYLSGLELFLPDSPNGYGVISYNGVPLGGYKASNGRLKNHYPKGLRNHL